MEEIMEKGMNYFKNRPKTYLCADSFAYNVGPHYTHFLNILEFLLSEYPHMDFYISHPRI